MAKIANDFINSGESQKLGLKNSQVLRMFGVNPNTYSSYCKRLIDQKAREEKEAEKAKKQEELDKEIMQEIARVIKKRHGNVPGKRSLQLYMLFYAGRYLSIRKCEKYLKKMGLYARGLNGNHYKGQDTYYHQCKAHPNLVMQDFYLGFREVILLDITYIPFNLGRGMCYHTFFYDPFLDQVLGEATSETMDVELIKKAYQRMMEDFGDEIRNKDRVYLHSDNGSQLMEASFMELTEKDNFERSFSRRATPGDNRPIEAMNSRLKLEISTNLLRCKNYKDASEMLTNYHRDRNENRVNLYLGGMTPNQYHDYILTGVFPLEEYYKIEASRLHPVKALIRRLKGLAEDRKDKSRREQERHRKKVDVLKDLLKTSPDKIIKTDQVAAIKEHAEAGKRKLAADADMEIWATMEKRIRKAVDFIVEADDETREKLKDRLNWKDYPVLDYVNDYPSYAIGKNGVDKSKLSKGMSELLDLWLVLDEWIVKAVDFISEADEETREAIKDKNNWKNYPEIALLAQQEEASEKASR